MKFKELLDREPKCLWCKVVMIAAFILLFTGVDLIVKEIVTQTLKGKPEVVVIPGFWSFYYVVNDDIGFSILRWLNNILKNPTAKWIFLVCLQGTGAIAVISFYFYSKPLKMLVPLALISSGALGNLIDRIIRGYVVDYVMWYYKSFVWPIWNLADMFIVIGAGLLFIVLFFFTKEEKKEE
ncbi:MAG TPA: signal peptidase II [Spirochaetota bacterium]|nr:signal peptidase II [Spirochaetota bacterium]